MLIIQRRPHKFCNIAFKKKEITFPFQVPKHPVVTTQVQIGK